MNHTKPNRRTPEEAFAAQVALLFYSAVTFQPKTYVDLPPER